jgi:hypothetical protein
MGRRDVLSHLAGARGQLLAAIEGLTPVELTTLFVSEAWTIREILAHIGGWAAWDLDTIKVIQQGNDPDFTIIQDVDAFNERLVAERSGWSLDQILAKMEHAQAATQELVDTMSDQNLLETGRFHGPYWDNLAEWLQVAWEHEEEHAVQIQVWRDQSFLKGDVTSTESCSE